MKYIINYKIFESEGKTFRGITLGNLVSNEGTVHIVFDIVGEPDKVLKLNRCLYHKEVLNKPLESWEEYELEDLKDFGEDMAKYPSIFATIYQHGEGYAVVEKIDTDRIQEEESLLRDFFDENYGKLPKFEDSSFDMNFDQEDGFPVLKELFKNNYFNTPLIKETAKRWYDFFKKIHKVYGYHVDVNCGNYGYDKDNILKLCDY